MKIRPVVAALALLTLSACGSQLLSDAQMERLERDGVDLSLVYLVELPGYTLAEQSLGVVGEDGFGASYTNSAGNVAHLRVEHVVHVADDGRTGDGCGAPLLDAAPGAPLSCARDDTGLYRSSGGRHEYVVVFGDHRLSLNAPSDDPDRAALTRALLDARSGAGDPPSSPGVPPVLPGNPSPAQPPRGDLPPIGDGAPADPPDAGG